jgi:hypothetical protein
VEVSLTDTLYEAFDNARYGLTYLVFAVFAAAAAFFGMVIIALAQFIKAVEVLLGGRNLGGDFVQGFGEKSLPDFWF